MKIASSPSPAIEVFVVSGGTDDLATANIFSLCIETETTILGGPAAVQLHPVFAIGEGGANARPNNGTHLILCE